MRISRSKPLCVVACAVALTAANPPAFAQQQAATYSPAQTKALEDMSDALALKRRDVGRPNRYDVRITLQRCPVGPNSKAAPNNIWRMENTSTPELAEKAGYVLPNLSVIYGFGFLDLRREPVILSLPDSHGLPLLRTADDEVGGTERTRAKYRLAIDLLRRADVAHRYVACRTVINRRPEKTWGRSSGDRPQVFAGLH